MRPDIRGLRDEPMRNPNGSIYKGRLALGDVQWTGTGSDAFATVTVTLAQIADAGESRILWTDQAVQRGIRPTAPPGTQREVPVADGYPDPQLYIFDSANADDIAEKLLAGDRLFLNPLVWNLRPDTFDAAWLEDEKELLLYDGRVYLPDSHHRHQAILKAVRSYREHQTGYPKLDLNKQFKVELYFLDRDDEGNYFFDKNQRPKPTALSKAYDLTTQDDLSTLAKRVLEHSPNLNAGTNRATDRLSKKAPHFVTLSTLRELMRLYAGTDEVEETELEGLAVIAAEFLDMLAQVRPELQASTTNAQREGSLASSGVIMIGYSQLLRDYSRDLAMLGSKDARRKWESLLSRLSPEVEFVHGIWEGDYLSKENPLWQELGVTRINPRTHTLNVSNTGGTRAAAARALREYVEQ